MTILQPLYSVYGSNFIRNVSSFNHIDTSKHNEHDEKRGAIFRRKHHSHSNESITRTIHNTNEENEGPNGWIPEAYPNPKIDPTQCGIESISNTLHYSISDQNDSLLNRLLLCDPDEVLTELSLENIALSLENFTFKYDFENNQTESSLIDFNNNNETIAKESSYQRAQIGVAIAEDIDVTAILRERIYYSFDDDDDAVNDAAQYFADYLHKKWWKYPEYDDSTVSLGGNFSRILIFLSIQNRVCFITAGNDPMFPWWRLDSIIDDMRDNLRDGLYSDAILFAIQELGYMLESGPPTAEEKIDDFISRFGIILSFSFFLFLFASWSEIRDREKRWIQFENKSHLDEVEQEKALLLQENYKQLECPICLESFPMTHNENSSKESKDSSDHVYCCSISSTGSDGLPLRLLRCGHAFDETCWRTWASSGSSEASKCPVCRKHISEPSADSADPVAENLGSYQIHSSYGTMYDGPSVSMNL